MADEAPREEQPVERVYITRSALRVIREEALDRHGPDGAENETGGILVGRRLNRTTLLVVAATDPGTRATRQQIMFEPDVAYVNQALAEFCRIYTKTDYFGTWHKHPLRYPRFSSGDVATAHAIFDDPDYAHIDETLNPIVWVDGGRVVVRYYHMSRVRASRRQPFIELPESAIIEIDDDDDLVRKERHDPEGSFLLRLTDERRLLTSAGYEVRVRQAQDAFYVVAREPERLPDATLYFTLDASFNNPPHYPRTAPVLLVARGTQDITPLSTAEVASLWAGPKGEPFLVDVAEAALVRLLDRPAARPGAPIRHIAPRERPAAREQRSRIGPTLGILSTATLALMAAIGVLARPAPTTTRPTAPAAVVLITETPAAPTSTPAPAFPTIARTSVMVAALQTTVATSGTPTPLSDTIIAGRWEVVDAGTTSTARRVELLEGLLALGVQQDPQGHLTAARLLDARLALAAEYTDQGAYAQARDVLADARQSAAAAVQQRIADAEAKVYLAEGDAALAKALFDAADGAYAQVGNLTPAPSESYRAEARRGRGTVQQRRTDLRALEDNLRAYDAALAADPPAWDAAISAIDAARTTIAASGLTAVPTPPYDPRLAALPDLLAGTWLARAEEAQQSGALDQAGRFYAQALDVAGISTGTAQAARDGAADLERAVMLWGQANRARRANDLRQERVALAELVELRGFGLQASNPQGGRSVESLLVALAGRERAATQTAIAQTAVAQAATAQAAATQTAAVPTPAPATAVAATAPAAPLTPALPVAPEPTSAPAATPEPVIYLVDISEIPADMMRAYLGLGADQPIPDGINAFVDGPRDLTMQIVYETEPPRTFQSNSPAIGIRTGRLARITVLNDSQGGVTTHGINAVTPEPGAYYRVAVFRR